MDRKHTAYYVLFQPSSNNCAAVVSYMAGYFKAAKQYYTSIKDLATGDIVFFQNSKGLSHVGICVDWSDANKTFTTVEGNKNSKVSKCTYKYSEVGGYVAGFGKPRYTDDLTRKNAIAYALSQVGYTEGANNWNKYADELDKVDYFAGCGRKQNLPWCCVFICAVMYNAFKVAPDPEPEPTPTPTDNKYKVINIKTFLAIRNTPEAKSDDSNKVGELYNGAIVTVIETSGSWAKISGDLWVSTKYLQKI